MDYLYLHWTEKILRRSQEEKEDSFNNEIKIHPGLKATFAN